MPRIEDKYPDVLQNIEFAVVSTYKEHPDMTDYSAIRVFEALLDVYSKEKTGMPPKNARLSELEQVLFGWARDMCEWRLGRKMPFSGPRAEQATDVDPIPLDDMILCLKRLSKSANRWNSVGGRQGYLNFIIQYVG